MSLPSVALLIPCYNSAQSLPLLLQDALQQTLAFNEMIVYDDASTDASGVIAEQLGCRVIRGEINLGAGHARQQLLEAASSQYVHFHDADDRMEPTFLETLLPKCDESLAVCCAMQEVGKDNKVTLRTYAALNEGTDQISFFIQSFVHMNTAIYPRMAAIEAGGFDAELRTNQDRVFHYRLAAANLRFKFVDQPLVTQIRNRQSTLSNTKFAAIVTNFIRGTEIALELFPPRYHALLGEYLLFYAEKAAYRGENALVHRAITAAKQCGIQRLETCGLPSQILSRVIGCEKTLIAKGQYARWRQSIGLSQAIDEQTTL
jgi:glycosyltransferase involved in cell wall biosynthesis